METAWCYVDWATLDSYDRSGQGTEWFRSGFDKLLAIPTGTPVATSQTYESRDKPTVSCLSSAANLYIRAGYWFSWYAIREISLSKRDKYALDVDQVTLTDWGRDCLTTLRKKRPFHFWNKNAFSHFLSDYDDGYDETVNITHFTDVFRLLLDEPELVSLYPINVNAPTGAYWLRIELLNHGVSRTIAIPATDTLDDLHLLMQTAVNFDDDHLYQFCLNPRNPYNGAQ